MVCDIYSIVLRHVPIGHTATLKVKCILPKNQAIEVDTNGKVYDLFRLHAGVDLINLYVYDLHFNEHPSSTYIVNRFEGNLITRDNHSSEHVEEFFDTITPVHQNQCGFSDDVQQNKPGLGSYAQQSQTGYGIVVQQEQTFVSARAKHQVRKRYSNSEAIPSDSGASVISLATMRRRGNSAIGSCSLRYLPNGRVLEKW
ncbi:uncharacterized protein LOC122061604 [Macadamia integrifolia]|uniref:uncharacterized protein LOC122061604 n=1 Tax=Macadamia integrifolia TaxID=60698 RepID=UPI001C52A237|nr:uncharacterized protein LOC122061604 [Macadamia integrifolia]